MLGDQPQELGKRLNLAAVRFLVDDFLDSGAVTIVLFEAEHNAVGHVAQLESHVCTGGHYRSP